MHVSAPGLMSSEHQSGVTMMEIKGKNPLLDDNATEERHSRLGAHVAGIKAAVCVPIGTKEYHCTSGFFVQQ